MLEPCPQAEEKEFEDRDDTLELVFPLEEGWDISTWTFKPVYPIKFIEVTFTIGDKE
jgi:hypothetical protein